jgi:hypothetical protein
MANNPQPAHITAEMWWFVEELERIESKDTVFAGAWGRFKPGYHCDYWELWNHKVDGAFIWRNDYSIKLPDDKVGGTPLEQFGAAVDWTFLSAQAGNFTNFRKYGGRIRAAWAAHDPRLKGWREVLCQGDPDVSADGYDFVSWTERTPDATHTWHMHFSVLRKFLRTLSVYRAMISILKGETLAQWLAGGEDDDMTVNTFWLSAAVHGAENDGFWISQGGWRELIRDNDDYGKLTLAHPGIRALPKPNANGWPESVLSNWSVDEVDRILGRRRVINADGTVGGGDDGDAGPHRHAISLTTASQTLTSQTGPDIPA